MSDSQNQEVQQNTQTDTFEDSTEFSSQFPNVSIAMIQFQQQEDTKNQLLQQNDIQQEKIDCQESETIKISNPNLDLEYQNQKLHEQNQKLYQQLSQTENQLNQSNQRVEELIQENKQNHLVMNDLKKLVDQQRDFINQINNDQAYIDLTESLEISLEKLKDMEIKNDKLMEENLYYKTKYEESLILIKNSKEETLNQQDRIDQLSQNHWKSSDEQFEKIKVLENEIKQLQNQLSEQ